jgi:DNA-binding transcriptional MerR regulator
MKEINEMEALSVHEAAEYTGLSAYTLRYYEREGLIQPIVRNDSGHRRYATIDLEHLIFLHCLRRAGMSIQQMRVYAELTRQGRDSLGARVELLEDHKNQIQKRITELQGLLEILDVKIDRLQGASVSDPAVLKAAGIRQPVRLNR